jgi:hypothetical protein
MSCSAYLALQYRTGSNADESAEFREGIQAGWDRAGNDEDVQAATLPVYFVVAHSGNGQPVTR